MQQEGQIDSARGTASDQMSGRSPRSGCNPVLVMKDLNNSGRRVAVADTVHTPPIPTTPTTGMALIRSIQFTIYTVRGQAGNACQL
jgi:hypothetical protein